MFYMHQYQGACGEVLKKTSSFKFTKLNFLSIKCRSQVQRAEYHIIMQGNVGTLLPSPLKVYKYIPVLLAHDSAYHLRDAYINHQKTLH